MTDKVVILGTYEFVGFHICKKVLEDGLEVRGIHVPIKEDALFIEEKLLEIGRNSNFSQCDYDKYDFDKEEYIFIVDFYDYFMRNCEQELLRLGDFFKKINNRNCRKVILLLPISLLGENQSKAEDLISSIKEDGIIVQSFFLPTIYGPWQPEEFLFQKSMVYEDSEYKITNREWTGDAIYVEDAAKTIINLLNDSSESLLLKSKEINSWNRCAEILSLPLEEKNQNRNDFQGQEKLIENPTSIQSGIENQKRIVQTLKVMGKLK